MASCYCGSNLPFENCCQPYINGILKAPTAEALMRSRYTAYAISDANYLVLTTHISTRSEHNKSDILEWSKSNKWNKLEIIESTQTTVTFKAFYTNNRGQAKIHFEKSTFAFENGNWYYVDGEY